MRPTRRPALIFLLALIFAALFYLYFVSSINIGPISYQRVPYINNYPKPDTSEQKKKGEEVFLGDRFRISIEVINNGIRSPEGLSLKLSFSQGMNIIDTNDKQVTEWVANNYPYSRNVKEIIFPVGNLSPFEHHALSIIVMSAQSGYLAVKGELIYAGVATPIQTLELQIKSRPTDSIPRVPADIISYLGDKAVENCKEHYPCTTLDSFGRCTSYPDSSKSKKCLIEQNQ